MDNKNERRQFLQRCLRLGVAVSAGGLMVAGCAGPKKSAPVKKDISAASANPCDDLTGVDPVDVEKRKALGYTSLSPIPDKQCDNCKLWVPVKEGKECGGCLLFAGPISPEGHCTYWAPPV